MNDGISTANTDYFQFTLASKTGYNLSLSSINAAFNGTSSFYASPGVSSQFAYSLNGTSFTLIGTAALITGSLPLTQTVDLTGISALQNLASTATVTFRYYASGQTTTGGWGFYSSASGQNGLAINGTLTASGPAYFYYDLNGTTAGSGASGTSSTFSGTHFNSAADGTGTTAAFSSGQTATFSAGTDAVNGTYTVNVDTAVSTNGITFNDANVTLAQASGGSITLAGPSISVASSATATIAPALAGSVGLTKVGAGTLILSGAGTYSGATLISAGTLQDNIANALPTATNLTLANVAGAAFNLNGVNQTVASVAGGGTTGGSIGVGANTLTENGSTSTSYAGTLTNSANGALSNQGSGTLTISSVLGTANVPLTLAIGSGATINLTETSGVTQNIASAAAATFAGNLTLTGGTSTTFRLNLDGGTYSGGGSISVQSSGTTIATGGTVTDVISNNIVLNTGAAGSFVTNIGPVSNSTMTINGVISGASDLNIAGGGTSGGTGTLILNQVETYTGATNINMTATGTLKLGITNALPTGTALTFGASGTPTGSIFDLNGFSQTVGTLSSNLGTQTGYSITNSGSTVSTLTVAGSATPANAFSGIISDGTSKIALAKSGLGTLTLAGANTFSGGVTVTGGSLVLGASGALGSTNALSVGVAAAPATVTFNLNGFNQTVASLQVYGGDSSSVVNGVTLAGGTLTVNGNIAYEASAGTADYPAAISGNGALDLGGSVRTFNIYSQTNPGGDLAISSSIQDGGIIKNQTGVLTLSAGNTYAGGTTITNGTIIVNTGGTLGASTGSLAVNAATGVTSALNLNVSQTVSGLSGTIAGTGTATINIASGFTLDSNQSAGTEYDGILAGSGAFTKDGAGTLILGGANTATGATTITAGTLQLGNASTTGTLSTSSAITDNGTFAINRSNAVAQGTDFSAAAITGSGSFTQAGTGTTTLNAANTYGGGTTVSNGTLTVNTGGTIGASTGSLAVNAATGITSALNLNVSQTVNGLSGTIAGTGKATITIASGFTLNSTQASSTKYDGILAGAGGLTKDGAGTLSLTNNASSYTGGTIINGGTIAVNGANRIGGNGVLTINNGTFQLTTISGSGTSVSNGGRNVVLGSANSTFEVDAGLSYTASTGVFSGSGSLNKAGTGTLALQAANTYNGATTINGTLSLSNSAGIALVNTTQVNINTGGTLLMGAANQVNAAAPISLGGGKLDAGGFAQGSSATVALGALTLAATSTIDLTGTSSILHFAASPTATAGTTLSILDWSGTATTGGGSELIKFGSANTDLGYLSQIQFVNPAGFATGTYSANFATGDPGEIVPGAMVPEPATVFGGALMLGLLGWSQRRRVAGLSSHLRARLAA